MMNDNIWLFLLGLSICVIVAVFIWVTLQLAGSRKSEKKKSSELARIKDEIKKKQEFDREHRNMPDDLTYETMTDLLNQIQNKSKEDVQDDN